MFSSVSLYVSDKNLIPAMLHELETIKSPKPLKYGQLHSSRSLKKATKHTFKELACLPVVHWLLKGPVTLSHARQAQTLS